MWEVMVFFLRHVQFIWEICIRVGPACGEILWCALVVSSVCRSVEMVSTVAVNSAMATMTYEE